MYYTVIDYIYFKYRKVVSFEALAPSFSKFADLMTLYGCPYEGNIGLIDGTFTFSCRPGGLQEKNQADQRDFYNGDKADHGWQTMAALLPNGMIVMSDPY
jgi:hypothetical protein